MALAPLNLHTHLSISSPSSFSSLYSPNYQTSNLFEIAKPPKNPRNKFSISSCTSSPHSSPIFLPFLQTPARKQAPEPEPEPNIESIDDPFPKFFKTRTSYPDPKNEGKISLQRNRRSSWHLAPTFDDPESEPATGNSIVSPPQNEETVSEVEDGVVGEILKIARGLSENVTLGEVLERCDFGGKLGEEECLEVLRVLGEEGNIMSCLYFFEWMGLREPCLVSPKACSVLFPALGKARKGKELSLVFKNLPFEQNLQFRDVRVYNAAISGLSNCGSASKKIPSLLMAAPLLHSRHHTFSAFSSPFPYNPRRHKPLFFLSPKPPLNPSKTPVSISFSILTISLLNNHRNSPFLPYASVNPNSNSEQEHNEKRLEEGRDAVREYLELVGASPEDATYISVNCADYIKMLIDGVHDLDDWNSWASAASPSQKIAGDAIEFKEKVQQMAEQKGDKGLLPFLESLGLSLSSATHLARYLSSSESNVLPLFIEKVKYVKEMLFSDSDDHEFIGKNARRMMAHLSISADEDVQQTLAFFEKIQARRGGLNLLGSESTSFRYLIESFPRLLFLPLESRMKPVVKFLEDIGVNKGYIRNVLLLFPPILSYDIEKDIKPRLKSFEKIGVKDNDYGKMLVKYPWILSASILENFEKVLGFFDKEKVPRVSSFQAIKSWPHILGCSVNKMKLMVEELSELGIENKKLGKVIATSPQLLLRKPQEFLQVVSFFKDLGMDDEAIGRTLGRCPEIFATSIDKTLERKLKFLSHILVPKSHIPRVVRKYPELFVCDVDRALLPRMRFLMMMGLSRKDIGFMVQRFSPLLGYSIEEVLRPKLEFLVKTMGKPVREVVEYPRYFSYSLEKKIKPRYWVLKSRNIEFTLKEMLGKNDEEFAELYLGVGDMLVPPP